MEITEEFAPGRSRPGRDPPDPGGPQNSGLDVADRIALRWTATDEATVAALTEHSGLIADEVLATDFAQGEADDADGEPFTDEGFLSLTFRLRKQ